MDWDSSKLQMKWENASSHKLHFILNEHGFGRFWRGNVMLGRTQPIKVFSATRASCSSWQQQQFAVQSKKDEFKSSLHVEMILDDHANFKTRNLRMQTTGGARCLEKDRRYRNPSFSVPLYLSSRGHHIASGSMNRVLPKEPFRRFQ
jgi:hypothetical protein